MGWSRRITGCPGRLAFRRSDLVSEFGAELHEHYGGSS